MQSQQCRTHHGQPRDIGPHGITCVATFHIRALMAPPRFNTEVTPLPQCNLTTEWHHWRQFIGLHAASFKTTKGFHKCSSTAQDLSTHFNVYNLYTCKSKYNVFGGGFQICKMYVEGNINAHSKITWQLSIMTNFLVPF